MEPITLELKLNADGEVSPGQGILVAWVPATDFGPPVALLACDPRRQPGQPTDELSTGTALAQSIERHQPDKTINELAPAVIAYLNEQGWDESLTARWAVIDSIGRFTEAVPFWRTSGHPVVSFEPFPGGLDIEAFFRATSASGEVAIEMLSALIETPDMSTEAPSERTFLETVEGHGNLPAPGGIFQRVDAAAVDGDARLMAEAIQPDPMLSLSLINSANAARFAGSGKTASVPQAVVRLGTSFVRRVVFVVEMMGRYQRGVCPTFDYRNFWLNSIASGACMRALMPDYDIAEKYADDAFTTGLVGGIGWLAVAETFPGLMATYVARCKGADPITKARAQQEIFPCAIRLVSERYLERYSFPKDVQHAVAGNTADGRTWFDCLAQSMRVAQSLVPFECIAVPTTIPVPDACKEEWERWKNALSISA